MEHILAKIPKSFVIDQTLQTLAKLCIYLIQTCHEVFSRHGLLASESLVKMKGTTFWQPSDLNCLGHKVEVVVRIHWSFPVACEVCMCPWKWPPWSVKKPDLVSLRTSLPYQPSPSLNHTCQRQRGRFKEFSVTIFSPICMGQTEMADIQAKIKRAVER